MVDAQGLAWIYLITALAFWLAWKDKKLFNWMELQMIKKAKHESKQRILDDQIAERDKLEQNLANAKDIDVRKRYQDRLNAIDLSIKELNKKLGK